MTEYICKCGHVHEYSESVDIEFQICPACERIGNWLPLSEAN
jgi:Zn-finger nucleic acid-binding protein